MRPFLTCLLFLFAGLCHADPTVYRLCQIDPEEILTESPEAGFPLERTVGNPAQWSAPAGCEYLPVVAATAPSFDPDTERLSRLPDAIIDDEVVTNRWEVVALTSDEITARQAEQIRAGLKIIYDAQDAATRTKFQGLKVAVWKALDDRDLSVAAAIIANPGVTLTSGEEAIQASMLTLFPSEE